MVRRPGCVCVCCMLNCSNVFAKTKTKKKGSVQRTIHKVYRKTHVQIAFTNGNLKTVRARVHYIHNFVYVIYLTLMLLSPSSLFLLAIDLFLPLPCYNNHLSVARKRTKSACIIFDNWHQTKSHLKWLLVNHPSYWNEKKNKKNMSFLTIYTIRFVVVVAFFSISQEWENEKNKINKHLLRGICFEALPIHGRLDALRFFFFLFYLVCMQLCIDVQTDAAE